MSSPPSKLLSRLNVAAPRHMAKKKSFRSAPRIVSGRDSDRCTLLIRLPSAMCLSLGDAGDLAAGEKPGQEIHCGDSHANAEEHAGENAFRATFTEGEGEAGHDDGHEREAASDGAGERCLEHADSVFPRRSSRLGERRSGKQEADRQGRHAVDEIWK